MPQPDEKPATPVPQPPPDGPPQDRRKFFSQAMRETMTPVAAMLEKRLNPILQAIEQFPDEINGALDALTPKPPEEARRRVPLDQIGVSHTIAHDESAARVGEPVRFLRPPGAIADFANVCSRCAACVRVCPAEAIRLDGNAGTLPYIVAEEKACVVCESLACMNHCPTAALQLTDKFAIDMGTAKVFHDTCLRTAGEACQLCVDACPLGQTAITISPATARVHVKIQGCIGCGVCEQACPTAPRSIIVMPSWQRQEPIVA